MKIIKPGPLPDEYKQEFTCSCRTVFEVDFNDLKLGRDGPLDQMIFVYVKCPVCDSQMTIPSLPKHIYDKIRS